MDANPMSAFDPKQHWSSGGLLAVNDRQRGTVATTAPTIGPLIAEGIFSKVPTDVERQYSPYDECHNKTEQSGHQRFCGNALRCTCSMMCWALRLCIAKFV